MSEKQITLKLPLSVVEYLLNLVNEQPRRVADPIFNLIASQAQVQVAEDAAPKVGKAVEPTGDAEKKDLND